MPDVKCMVQKQAEQNGVSVCAATHYYDYSFFSLFTGMPTAETAQKCGLAY